MGRKKTKPPASLAKGRPPVFSSQPQHSMSRKAGRKLINDHHTLQKQRKQAADRGNTEQERAIAAQIAALGGLDKYQQASLQGQRLDRGGDTSRVLLEWLAPGLPHAKARRPKGRADGSSSSSSSSSTTMAAGRQTRGPDEGKKKSATRRRCLLSDRDRPRMLEVGALSTQNACAASGLFDMELIDLKSRERGIIEQDFMKRPLPSAAAGSESGSEDGLFDVISLSLVLNYVPDARGRGEMLRRTLRFLRRRPDGGLPAHVCRGCDGHGDDDGEGGDADSPYPCLFLVLPRPCVSNSRFFSEERLGKLMALLGYEQIRSKLTEKLVYYLWRWRAPSPPSPNGPTDGLQVPVPPGVPIAKKEVKPVRARNNFAIVLEPLPPS